MKRLPRKGAKNQYFIFVKHLNSSRIDATPVLLTGAERAQAAEQRALIAEERAQTAEQRAEQLAAQLRALGIDPDQLPN
ncbi:hypothetical protein H6G69_18040 [Nostoc sp. FACHB-110]|nr:hypothetical protein [Nostoc sp. FACHB-110]